MSDAPAVRALALTGPTTSRKTRLSLELARRLGGEIISMDSRQVYRGMDIGTDKVDAEARARVRHFGLDLIEPDQSYSAGQFARDVRRWIPEIEARGHVPVLTGGTGFFLRAVLQPIFREPSLDPERLRRLRACLSGMDMDVLRRWVASLDPERCAVAESGGRQRLSRTLEVALLTGRPLSWWHLEAPADGPAVPCLVTVLEVPRGELDRRIDERVSQMVARGLIDEVQRLLDEGYGPEDPGMTGNGYREIAAHLAGSTTLGEALDEMRGETRRYARRQMTWFRNQLPEDAVRIDGLLPLERQADLVEDAWLERSDVGSS